ncbi:ABC transporter substrate-binding protein [Lachnospiraceae bacterium oral taxon 500]|nr:ABC transporter substrate-binding protein [Lachnospiraceae bacterium oral taxon 500]
MKTKFLKMMSLGLVLMVLMTACGTSKTTPTDSAYANQQTPAAEKKDETKPEEKKDETKPVEEQKDTKTDETKPAENTAENYGDRTFQVVMPAGVPTIGLAKMIKESPEVNGAKMAYDSVVATDTLAPKLISGEADFAVVPSNLAIKVYNKGAAYQYAGSTVWGVLYLAAADDSVKDWADLKGKTITLIGRGLTPDLTLRYLLTKNGLTPDTDVTFEYVAGATELAPLFLSGKAGIALLPEPMLTQVLTKKPETKVVFDIQAEWKKATGSEDSYPQTAVLVKKEVAENYPELVKEFLAKLAESIEFANTDPQAVGAYMEELSDNLKAPVVAKAIPNCNLMYKDAAEAKVALEKYYTELMNFGAENIGGKMPDEAFYYQK